MGLLRRDAPRNDGGSRGRHCDILPAVIASPLGCGYTKCDVVNPLVVRALIAAWDCFVAMLLAMTRKVKDVIANEVKQSPGCEGTYC